MTIYPRDRVKSVDWVCLETIYPSPCEIAAPIACFIASIRSRIKLAICTGSSPFSANTLMAAKTSRSCREDLSNPSNFDRRSLIFSQQSIAPRCPDCTWGAIANCAVSKRSSSKTNQNELLLRMTKAKGHPSKPLKRPYINTYR